MSKALDICLLPLFFLLSFHIAYAQHRTESSPPAVSDSLIEEFNRKWPNLRLVELDSKLVESLIMVEMEKYIDRLETIAEVVAPAPLPTFASIAIEAARSTQSFEKFVMAVCRAYGEYDCEYDFDFDAMLQAFSIAKQVVNEAHWAPSLLYLLTTGPNNCPSIHAMLAFDSLVGYFRVVSYTYPLDIVNRRLLLNYFDSTTASYLPVIAPFPNELELLSIDSIKRWSAINDTARSYEGIVPHQSYGFELLWLYVSGERGKEFGPIVAQVNRLRRIGFWGETGVDSIEASCHATSTIGLAPPRIVRTGNLGWTLLLEVRDAELFEETMQKNAEIRLNVELSLTDRKGSPSYSRMGKGNVAITIISDDFGDK